MHDLCQHGIAILKVTHLKREVLEFCDYWKGGVVWVDLAEIMRNPVQRRRMHGVSELKSVKSETMFR
jgi:hypothetical protein